MQYLSVKNLEVYQHYKDRDPKWIKLYYSILDDEVFMVLDETMRCRYITCLIIASRTHNKIPYDKSYLKKIMRLDKAPNLQPLIDHGFLVYHPSSIPLDDDKHLSQGPNHSLLSSPLLSPLSVPKMSPDLKSNSHAERNGRGPRPFPDDLVFNDTIKSSWADHGIDPGIEFAKFRDYHRARATRFTDWMAAWRNWARKAIELKEASHVRPVR